ncbi:GAF domain-containing sensor histidine kinase [Longimicrobium sp.]|uniref:sensor histidine kinase n=1 Tax=Longimicrobium sp. TaxID=2029185 RepID=UPI002D16010E|nr:GAF domain-containing sensor histidine kinase [Longimicrobium sp.]HSU15838.1 GAF domain-containing sensor histidine kinase [Longimicrobium sp.]
MQYPAIALLACQQDDPASAFGALVEALRETLPLHCAAWVAGDPPAALTRFPPELELSSELCEMVAHARRAEVYPASVLCREISAAYPGAELLTLPVSDGRAAGGLMLAAPAGVFADPAEPWLVVGEALANVHARDRALRESRDECEALRQRAEEGEALDVLGLAANRTLDPEEVLTLVSRFTRTLLSADYVTVSTVDEGGVRLRSSVGLCTADGGVEDPLARLVIHTGKPLFVGGGQALPTRDFPLHVAEGMVEGLGVPLSVFGETFGALIVGHRTAYHVTRRDTRLAVTLARHAAVAISNAQLHRAVESRSQELEAAYERLRELSVVKERFFATMSHELRTPITAVKGYGDLLLDGIAGELPPQARRYVERSRTAALTLLGLINDLLDFAKIEAGKMEVELRPCPVADALEGALAAVEPQARAKGLQLRTLPPAPMPSPLADDKRLRQILTNLLSNAVKFTERGQVSLSAAWRPDGHPGPAPGGWVEIRVADTGRGIPPEHLDRVFAEFEQVPGSDGTGLGLPISRKLARLMGGDLTAESRCGAGSTFILRLPAAAAAISAPSRQPAALPC